MICFFGVGVGMYISSRKSKSKRHKYFLHDDIKFYGKRKKKETDKD